MDPMGSENVKTGVNRAEVPHHLQICECPPPPGVRNREIRSEECENQISWKRGNQSIPNILIMIIYSDIVNTIDQKMALWVHTYILTGTRVWYKAAGTNQYYGGGASVSVSPPTRCLNCPPPPPNTMRHPTLIIKPRQNIYFSYN